MTTITDPTTVRVFRVFIKASPEAIWDAITKPEWAQRYGYGAPVEYDLRAGGSYRVYASKEMGEQGAPDVIIDGEVVEADPPRRLVQTWRPLFDPELAAEGARRLTWEIEPSPGGVTRLTVTHELEGAPRTAALVTGEVTEAGGGWSYVISDLKTLLETGATLGG